MIVVDASVLVDFLVGRPATITAVEEELAGREHEQLHAPELIEPEVLNALRRLVSSGAVHAQRAATAVSDLGDVRLFRHPHAPLRERVWELRDQLTAYDASYLALTEALDARLLTADAGLATRTRSSLGDDRVRRIP